MRDRSHETWDWPLDQRVPTRTDAQSRDVVSDAGLESRPTVLLIEDDPTLRSTLSFNLGRDGYRVLLAADGLSGLATALQELPGLDLVILDLMLPGMSGLHVLRQLRTHSGVPVVILSARGEEQDRIDGLELGADDYVVKPFALREFLARVRANIRRYAVPGAQPPVTVTRGPLRIELNRRQVFAGTHELVFRPKEFGLLVALAMEPGRVFSRVDLLDAVWGTEIVVDPRTVDVHISWLRAKLSEAGLPPNLIQTVYGAGYRFRAEPIVEPLEPEREGA